MQKSIWVDTVKLPVYDTLKKDIKTDVLVIGGGICGMLCAYFLKRDGIDCVVAESSTIASGTTKNTTAKITSQHGLIYSDLVKNNGEDFARVYLNAQQTALSEYESLCKETDCDFIRQSSYIYSLDNRRKVENEINALEKIGFKACFKNNTELPFKIAGAVQFENQAQFNPLKFISELSKNLNIYENTFVREIVSGKAITDNATIKADSIIVATHFPFINRHGNYFLKLYQHRSYVLAIENAQELNGMYADECDTGFSFRNSKNLLLLGGGGGRTGKKCNGWEDLIKFKNQNYPDSKIKYSWAAQDCMSLDKIPYIGRYSKKTQNLYVATGFNKWGMTSSMAAAAVLTDMIQGRKNDYADVFSPSRSILKPQLFVNGFETLTNFIRPTPKRCPHLGCALKWNKAEHTWDCSCHGSRFDEDGSLIDNPAKKDADV